jgi:hypothetical protein
MSKPPKDASPKSPREDGGPSREATPSDRAEPGPGPGDIPNPPVIHGHDEACCCDHITLYLMDVKVETATRAPVPLIGLLGHLVDDRVAIRCESCDGSRFIWPSNTPGQECPMGKTVAIRAPLATVKPDGSCWVDCHVKVQAIRASRVTEILDAINNLLPELLTAVAALAGAQAANGAASQALAIARALLMGNPANPTLVQQAAQAETQKDNAEQAEKQAQAKVDAIKAKIKALEDAILRTGDNLMGEFFFNFDGPLGCGKSALQAIEPTDGATADPSNQDVALYEHVAEAYGGRWVFHFKAVKSCSARVKDKGK